MLGGRQTATVFRTFLALSVSLTAAAPGYAMVPGPRPAFDAASVSDLLLKIQSVDPGGPDGGTDGGNGGPDGNGGTDGNGGNPTGGNDQTDGRSTSDHDRRVPDWPILSSRDTSRVVQDLAAVRRECARFDDVYRIDCLRQGLDMVAANMPDRPENREAKRILRRASRQLAAIVTTYEDRDAPVVEIPRNVNPRYKKRRTLRAVKKSALPRAMAKAKTVVAEATTQLLRSAENSERRYAHYQQIAAAVDSTKVLLRSG